MPGKDTKREAKQPRYKVGHAGYVSEFGTFIQDYLDEHPDVAKDQLTGWNHFWDHDVDFNELEKAGNDNVPVKAYNYF